MTLSSCFVSMAVSAVFNLSLTEKEDFILLISPSLLTLSFFSFYTLYQIPMDIWFYSYYRDVTKFCNGEGALQYFSYRSGVFRPTNIKQHPFFIHLSAISLNFSLSVLFLFYILFEHKNINYCVTDYKDRLSCALVSKCICWRQNC